MTRVESPPPDWWICPPDLLQSDDLAARDASVLLRGALQSSEEQVQAVLVFGQQGRRRLVVLPQDELQELRLGLQQGGRVGAGLQEAVEDRKQAGELRLRGGRGGDTAWIFRRPLTRSDCEVKDQRRNQ